MVISADAPSEVESELEEPVPNLNERQHQFDRSENEEGEGEAVDPDESGFDEGGSDEDGAARSNHKKTTPFPDGEDEEVIDLRPLLNDPPFQCPMCRKNDFSAKGGLTKSHLPKEHNYSSKRAKWENQYLDLA